MAKDTEKLIRQLSLISYLMAERRPVTALEIRRDVEGYSGMNEDAFARRFYADRAELSDLGIQLTIDKPIDRAVCIGGENACPPEDVGGAPGYEEARAELIEVVRALEAGGTTLEESLALWERGEQLAAVCQQWLDGARRRLDAALDTDEG